MKKKVILELNMKIEDTNIRKFIAISDVISLSNMSCGFLSIVCSINHGFELAALLMIFAIMFDSVDGWVARKTNRNDELDFGKTSCPKYMLDQNIKIQTKEDLYNFLMENKFEILIGGTD